jgi:hypothetical protein
LTQGLNLNADLVKTFSGKLKAAGAGNALPFFELLSKAVLAS